MRVPIQACRQVPLRRAGLLGMALLAAATVLMGFAACGAGQRDNGVVYGKVFGSGGPAVVSRSGKVGTAIENVPMKNLTVTASRPHSSTKFKTVTSHDGGFSLSVPPGTYVVEATCGKAEPPAVRVSPGVRVKRNLHCVFL